MTTFCNAFYEPYLSTGGCDIEEQYPSAAEDITCVCVCEKEGGEGGGDSNQPLGRHAGKTNICPNFVKLNKTKEVL
jgi:hypothetical protein